MLKLTLRAALGALIAVMAVLATPALAFDHQPWDDLLQAHVSEHRDGVASAVDYDGMASDQAALDDYLARLSAVDNATFKGFSDAEKLALLARCSCLLYTPSNEHFGIVPIEVGDGPASGC